MPRTHRSAVGDRVVRVVVLVSLACCALILLLIVVLVVLAVFFPEAAQWVLGGRELLD